MTKTIIHHRTRSRPCLKFVGSFASLAAFALIVSLTPVTTSAQPQAKYRAAVAIFSFQELRAMPIFTNPTIKVGDVINVEYETTEVAAEMCFPNLTTRPPSFIGDHARRVSSDTALELSGASRINPMISADASFSNAISAYSFIVIDNIVRFQPEPDQTALSRDNVSNHSVCDVVRGLFDNQLQSRLLATTVYSASVFGLFQYASTERVQAGLAFDQLTRRLGSGNVSIRHSSGGSQIHIARRPEGTFAVQWSRINLDELARIYAYFQAPQQNLQEFERQVHLYLTGEDPGLLSEIKASLSRILSGLGFYENRLETLKKRLTEGGTLVDVAELDAQQMNAAGLVAGAAAIADHP